nr:377_t:CDS:2 [Entrophospora candida]
MAVRLRNIFDRYKEDWGFGENDYWNRQNQEELLMTFQEFICRDKDYQLQSGWKLSDNQYRYTTKPPFKLRGLVFAVYGNILGKIADFESVRDDLLGLYLKSFLYDGDRCNDEVYNQIADFFWTS